jgi:hypothetical protein
MLTKSEGRLGTDEMVPLHACLAQFDLWIAALHDDTHDWSQTSRLHRTSAILSVPALLSLNLSNSRTSTILKDKEQSNLDPVLKLTNVCYAGNTISNKKTLTTSLTAAVGVGGSSVLVAPVAIAGLGYTSAGITAGSWAAWIMSAEAGMAGGGVATGGLSATLQSAGAVGLMGAGLGLTTCLFAVGAVVGGPAAMYTVRHNRMNAIRLGTIATLDQGLAVFAHGNVVALVSSKHNRILRVGDQSLIDAYGKCSDQPPSLPLEWDRERFLVVRVGERNCALFSLSARRFIRVVDENGLSLSGLERASNLEPTGGEIFTIQKGINGNVSFFSQMTGSFVSINQKGVVSALATEAGESEHFKVLVLI